ncbi:MAG TPA: hypothetical protein VK465_02545, partial [Fibrobacteria bacterium]|nr:hypothetical protein [Fibrobacteria bacterium]
MFLKWLPWKYLVRRVARAHGFLDPIHILSRLGNFAQPSEVGEPIELLRAGVIFHARGLMNTRAIQNNLDWIWPYWVERQFNPHDVSFIPRAFSISHVNLSHRNWTSVGLPNSPFLPLVDPSGLVTPYYDGWSIDAWLIQPGGRDLIPSKAKAIAQTLELEPDNLAVETAIGGAGRGLESRVDMEPGGSGGICRILFKAQSDRQAFLAVSLRPYNPEGVSFIHDIHLDKDRRLWTVNGAPAVRLGDPAELHYASEYHVGDVYRKVVNPESRETSSVKCKVGMATAAALFAIPAGGNREISLRVDLDHDKESKNQIPKWRKPVSWAAGLAGTARFRTPDARYNFLYDAAVRSLLTHSPGEVFPGPYTYKRFWFRDAAFILDALVAAGLEDRAEQTLVLFPSKQSLGGYFLSQEGEWDSNGEALWILRRWCQTTGRKPREAWLSTIAKGGDWIVKKRMGRRGDSETDRLVEGLFPAGFSAEHLGPNDYYYWDDFWGVAGLESAADLLESAAPERFAADITRFRSVAVEFRAAIDRSIAAAQKGKGLGQAVPASPLRRMDSGAIGNIAASYPLAIWSPEDPRMAATLRYLLDRCLYKGGFFQDMIHSGINAYLTLHMAQALLRAGDPRALHLIRDTAAVATRTGQWPEAIHPHTLGGCMGDGQHVWAAAEWVLMMRNL